MCCCERTAVRQGSAQPGWKYANPTDPKVNMPLFRFGGALLFLETGGGGEGLFLWRHPFVLGTFSALATRCKRVAGGGGGVTLNRSAHKGAPSLGFGRVQSTLGTGACFHVSASAATLFSSFCICLVFVVALSSFAFLFSPVFLVSFRVVWGVAFRELSSLVCCCERTAVRKGSAQPGWKYANPANRK